MENIKHIEGEFKGYQDLNLHYRCWLPPGNLREILIVIHGLAEHSGRYLNLVNHFVPGGCGVYAFDLRGHGKSPGLRGYVDRFSDFLQDLHQFVSMVRNKHPDERVFLFGHSVGGMIATAYAVQHQQEFRGLILSAPTLQPGASVSAVVKVVARGLSVLAPKLGLDVIDASAVSRDKAVVDAYVNDPLVYRGKIRARLAGELLKTMQALPGQVSQITLPVLVMHGSADRLSEPEGSRMLYRRIGSADKTLKFYEGFYHEIFNEPGREQVLADLESWLEKHA